VEGDNLKKMLAGLFDGAGKNPKFTPDINLADELRAQAAEDYAGSLLDETIDLCGPIGAEVALFGCAAMVYDALLTKDEMQVKGWKMALTAMNKIVAERGYVTK
jgi:hypothetical protein